jgi:hypothetical protein
MPVPTPLVLCREKAHIRVLSLAPSMALNVPAKH